MCERLCKSSFVWIYEHTERKRLLFRYLTPYHSCLCITQDFLGNRRACADLVAPTVSSYFANYSKSIINSSHAFLRTRTKASVTKEHEWRKSLKTLKTLKKVISSLPAMLSEIFRKDFFQMLMKAQVIYWYWIFSFIDIFYRFTSNKFVYVCT